MSSLRQSRFRDQFGRDPSEDSEFQIRSNGIGYYGGNLSTHNSRNTDGRYGGNLSTHNSRNEDRYYGGNLSTHNSRNKDGYYGRNLRTQGSRNEDGYYGGNSSTHNSRNDDRNYGGNLSTHNSRIFGRRSRSLSPINVPSGQLKTPGSAKEVLEEIKRTIFTPVKSGGKIGNFDNMRGETFPDRQRSLRLEEDEDAWEDTNKMNQRFISSGPPMLLETFGLSKFHEWQINMTDYLGKLPGFKKEILTIEPEFEDLKGDT